MITNVAKTEMKFRSRCTLPILLLIISSTRLCGQFNEDNFAESFSEENLEILANELEIEEVDLSTLIESWTYFVHNPIDLNHTSPQELRRLRILNDVQIRNIFRHIRSNGPLLSIYELQAIPGIGIKDAKRLLPFVKIGTEAAKIEVKDLIAASKNKLYLRYARTLENQLGYSPIADSLLTLSPNSRYLGSPAALYLKFLSNAGNHLRWGFTAEKDPGEQFFKGNQKAGFDFYSAHIYLQDLGYIKSLALGDFQAQFGQGLTFWSGYSFNSYASSLRVKKVAQGIKPYTSSNENKYLRGLGSTVSIEDFTISAFISMKRFDGNTYEYSDSGYVSIPVITSFNTTGYHRTKSEIEDKNAISEMLTGGNVSYQKGPIKIGLTGVQWIYSGLIQNYSGSYNQFHFSGDKNANIGFDYNIILSNLNWFGETAISANGALAMINGMYIHVDPKTSITVLHRIYDRNYQALMTNAFPSNYGTSNQNGLYAGIEYVHNSKWSFLAHSDHYRFPWLKYNTNGPSVGSEYFGQIIHEKRKSYKMYLRFRQRRYQENSSLLAPIEYLSDHRQHNVRYDFKYMVGTTSYMRSRIEFVERRNDNNNVNNEYGYFFSQDISYAIKKIKARLTMRYALFDTDGYNTRIYAFENDVLHAYSIPSHYGNGIRYFILLQKSLTNKFDFWIKYAKTIFNDRDLISSGLNLIEGNTRSDIKMQIRYTF